MKPATGVHCCAKHGHEHREDELRRVEAAGMRIIRVHRATQPADTGEYVLIYPDGTGSVHPVFETALGEADELAQMAATRTRKQLKRNITEVLAGYGSPEHPALRPIFTAIDAYAATRKGTPDLAKLARGAS